MKLNLLCSKTTVSTFKLTLFEKNRKETLYKVCLRTTLITLERTLLENYQKRSLLENYCKPTLLSFVATSIGETVWIVMPSGAYSRCRIVDKCWTKRCKTNLRCKSLTRYVYMLLSPSEFDTKVRLTRFLFERPDLPMTNNRFIKDNTVIGIVSSFHRSFKKSKQ